jgi:hypothetical protein
VAFFVYSLCPCPRFVFLFNDIPPTYEKKKKKRNAYKHLEEWSQLANCKLIQIGPRTLKLAKTKSWKVPNVPMKSNILTKSTIIITQIMN